MRERTEGRKLRCKFLIIDPRVKVPTDAHYAGNLPLSKRINREYVRSSIWKVRRLFKDKYMIISAFYDNRDENDSPIIRGTLERDPINDYIRFYTHGVDLYLLYSKYFDSPINASFLSVIRSSIEILRTIDYFAETHIHLNLHPIMIAIIKKWFEKEMPKLSILIFVAVMTTKTDEQIDIREYGSKEIGSDIRYTSRYGQALCSYIDLINEHQVPFMPEGGKTADAVKRLIKAFELGADDMKVPDPNEFHHYLVAFINEHFSRMTLKSTGHSKYRSAVFNDQMNWMITAKDHTPEAIFPVLAYQRGNHMEVKTFVPLE
jgi:hypothetical protein